MSLVSNLCHSLSLSLSFMILTLLRRVLVSLFYRLFLNLNLSDLFSWLHWCYTFNKNPLEVTFALFGAGISGGIQFLCFITSDINLDHLDKVMSSTVFYDKCMIFQFVVINALWDYVISILWGYAIIQFILYILPLILIPSVVLACNNYYSSIYLMIIFIFSLFSIYSLTEIPL